MCKFGLVGKGVQELFYVQLVILIAVYMYNFKLIYHGKFQAVLLWKKNGFMVSG